MEPAELTRRREALGYSRPEFARVIDVAESTVWRWEVRGVKPNTVMAKHLERTLRALERRKRPAAARPEGTADGA